MLIVLLLLLFAEPPLKALDYAPGPADNPLKGLVPYAGTHAGAFPHSMEFNYLPFAALVKGPDAHDWTALEKLLDDIAGRRHQAVVRIFLEYPGKKGVIPEFLVREGLKVHKYLYTETQPEPPKPIETPDYANPALRRELRAFVAAFGAKYDGDPRLAYVTAGLLGTWGEWHTYPRTELFAKKDVQAEVLAAYAAAFKKTPVLLRYPAGADDDEKAQNAALPFGYHDDSFAWATLATGRKQDDWFFVPALQSCRRDGEMADAADRRGDPAGSLGPSVRRAARQQKYSGLPPLRGRNPCHLADGFGDVQQAASARARPPRAAEVRRMGYDLHVPRAGVQRAGRNLEVAFALENRGAAPLYHDWPLEAGVFDAQGKLLAATPIPAKAAGLLTGAPARAWSGAVPVPAAAPNGVLAVGLRIKNPLPNGLSVRFANAAQDRVAAGWLILGNTP